MSSQLHQLTMSFLPEQDRMLLRISTGDGIEYQFWLTRRFIKILWRALLQVLERNPKLGGDLLPGVRDAILAMQHQEMIQTADFSQKHNEGNVQRTSNAGPLLVVGGTVSAIDDQQTRITLKTEDGNGVAFGLTKQLLHALCHMVISTTHQAEWDLDLTVGDAAAVVVPDRANVH